VLKLTFHYPYCPLTNGAVDITSSKSLDLQVAFKTWVYSGGEIQVRLLDLPEPPATATIFALLRSAQDFLELLMLTNAIREHYYELPITLKCLYLPGARQDRVSSPGDAWALKVYAQALNTQNYTRVEVLDPHSEVALKLVDRIYALDAETIAAQVLKDTPAGQAAIPDWSKVALIAADAGGATRANALGKKLQIPVVGQGQKNRDPATGEILSTTVKGNPEKDHTLIIADDICDGGRTFIELAKVLRPYQPKAIVLYVSHGIFSKGLAVFEGYIDHVLTPYSFQ
jgi:ribose-phosphate pyrophosphokinase